MKNKKFKLKKAWRESMVKGNEEGTMLMA